MDWWSDREQVTCEAQDKQRGSQEATTGSQGYVVSEKWICFAPSDVQGTSLRAGGRGTAGPRISRGCAELAWSGGKLWRTFSQLPRGELELSATKIAPCT